MISHEALTALKEALSANRLDGPLSLREFGEMLGRAADRGPYHKSTVSKMLRGKAPISARVERAARVLMVSVGGLDERGWIDPLPSFEGGPVAKLQGARAAGVDWRELYATDASVREFVDTLVDIICRG